MRIKRILITLLVALMMFSLVAVASAAEESEASMEVVTEVDAETKIDDGFFNNTDDGLELTYNVIVTKNPGISLLTLHVYYDPTVLTFVPDSVTSEVFSEEGIKLPPAAEEGNISIALIGDATTKETGVVLVSLKFTVPADFHGSVDSLTVGSVKPGDGTVANATQSVFEIHSFDSSETKEATCTTPGAISYTCSVCNEVHDVVTSDLAEHKYADATCTDPKTCTVCGATDGEALGHTWVDATCTDPKTCSVCQATEGEALGHTWVDATCTSPKTCSVCQTTEGPVAPHSYGDWTQTKAPTTEEEGEETRTCSVCQDKETRPVEKLVAKAGSKGWIVAVVIIAVVVVCAGVVVGVVFYKQKKSY